MKISKNYFSPLLAIAVFASATAAQAAIHRVNPGESIQDAIDQANPGDTVLVEPGIYEEDGGSRYGLRITTDNLRLIGRSSQDDGVENKVRLIANGDQETGIYAAPEGCDYDEQEGTCNAPDLQGFYVRGFSVEDFPVNGIQTRWVDGFEFVRNESVRNLNNGIYPTLSANGLVSHNESYGSLDTAMWVAGSENVRVVGNTLHSSVIGFEITVSNEVEFRGNAVYNNSVGIGLFHPNGAGNPPLPVMANWVIEQNAIYDNNLSPNPAPPGSFQADLPPGVGVLLLGVSDHTIRKNSVEDNGFVGIGVLGWCTATDGTNNSCDNKPPIADPGANNNLVANNYSSGNGTMPPGLPTDFLAADFTYFQFEEASGNCFRDNKPRANGGFTYVSSEGELPTDGC